ncbi:MAG: ABC transporter ATP-binding protein [Microbacteriaceae bacterium]
MTDHEPLNLSPAETGEPALRCDNVFKSFGGAKAVNGATFAVPRGRITALIGPNGAGKTTVVNILSGAMSSDSGSVTLGSTPVTGWPSYKIARLGLIRTFQLSRELGGLTVLENLLVAPKFQAGETLFNIYFRPGLVKRQERANLERAAEILHTYGLYGLRDSWARELSGGQKRLLEIARAVMAQPSVLLLDEPMAGINPALIDRIGDHIVDLKNAGVTVLMVEHNLNVVEKICDHVIVLAEGRTLASGRMSDLRANTEVVQAYLGGVLDARIDS